MSSASVPDSLSLRLSFPSSIRTSGRSIGEILSSVSVDGLLEAVEDCGTGGFRSVRWVCLRYFVFRFVCDCCLLETAVDAGRSKTCYDCNGVGLAT